MRLVKQTSERRLGPAAKTPRRRVRTIALLTVVSSAALVMLVVVASFFIDEPLRRYMERAINAGTAAAFGAVSGP